MYVKIIYLLFFNVSMTAAKGLLPGTFFWKPRLGAFSYGKKGGAAAASATAGGNLAVVAAPTKVNIEAGVVVLIDGYSLGLTVLAVVTGYHAGNKPFLHLHPRTASYYTNAYRWGLRHLSLMAPWIGGLGSGKYTDTHKVWRRRFYYMEEFVPKWLRRLTPWIDEQEWKDEETFMTVYNFFAEPAFGKHYRYPTRTFNWYKSQYTEETIENLDGRFG